jgi:hypothetical protein
MYKSTSKEELFRTCRSFKEFLLLNNKGGFYKYFLRWMKVRFGDEADPTV